MNNEVRDGYGRVVGYRCFRCGGVFKSMWDTTCNHCRHQDEENEKLREEIRRLTKAIENQKI